MNRQEIELAIHQKKMARDTWYYTRNQAEEMINQLTYEVAKLENELVGVQTDEITE